MSSNDQISSGRLRHLMHSSSFVDMKLPDHISGHKHGPSCGTSCGHDHDGAEYTSKNSQDGDIGE